MYNRAEYKEEEINSAKRVLQDHYTIMVREYKIRNKKESPNKGEEEETAKWSIYEERTI